jgi:hypothetical protein
MEAIPLPKENATSSPGDGAIEEQQIVRVAAAEDKARVIDTGDLWWQTFDTPEMFAEAERRLGDSLGSGNFGGTGYGNSREKKTAQAHREP